MSSGWGETKTCVIGGRAYQRPTNLCGHTQPATTEWTGWLPKLLSIEISLIQLPTEWKGETNGMEFEQQHVPPATANAPMSRIARYVGAGMLAVGLMAGGAAAVFAASPDPSTAPAPQSTTAPDQGGSGG